MATIRIDANGELDDFWGIGGFQNFDFCLGAVETIQDAILIDDAYLLAGAKMDASMTFNSFVVQLDLDGVSDTNFGEFGSTTVDIVQLGSDIANAIAL